MSVRDSIWLGDAWRHGTPRPYRVNVRDVVAYNLNRASAARRTGNAYWARFWLAEARQMRRAASN